MFCRVWSTELDPEVADYDGGDIERLLEAGDGEILFCYPHDRLNDVHEYRYPTTSRATYPGQWSITGKRMHSFVPSRTLMNVHQPVSRRTAEHGVILGGGV
jgi:hypothetical protein